MDKNNSYTLSGTHKSVLPAPIPYDDYDPFAHRFVNTPNSTFDSLIHMVKGSLGVGLFAMPMAFKHGGYIFGLFATIVVGIICTHCVYILVETSHKICKKTKTPSLGFADTAEMVFANGPIPLQRYSVLVKKVCDIAMISTYTGACCVYIVLIASSFQGVVNNQLGLNWNLRIYIGFAIVACLLIGQNRVLKYIVPFSIIANVMILAVVGITLYITVDNTLSITDRHASFVLGELASYFSIVIFSIEGVGTVMPIENQMKYPQRMLGRCGVLNMSMIIVVLLYTTIGLLGYLRYGDAVLESVTLNFPIDNVSSKVVQYLLGFAVLFTFGLVFYVPSEILWGKISPTIAVKHHNWAEVVFRIIMVLVVGGTVMALPNLGPYMGLIGAICLSTLGLLVPALIHAVNEWPQTGRFHLILIKDVTLVVASIVILIAGTWVNILNIIAIYS